MEKNGADKSPTFFFDRTFVHSDFCPSTEETPPNKETYIGLSSTQFKFRFSNHESSFENQSGRNKTTLSHHIWNLKDNDVNYVQGNQQGCLGT